MNIEKYQQNGLEIYINSENGEAFTSQAALARMCGVVPDTIRNFVKGVEDEPIKTVKVPTTGGLQGVRVLNERIIRLAFKKYAPDLYDKCTEAGVRVFLHKLAGYQISSTPVEKIEYQTPKMISPGSVEDTVTGIELLFNKMNITASYLPGILAEAVKERHPDLKEVAETMKIKMALNPSNDIGEQSYTVTEIGQKLEPPLSALKLNKLLYAMGYQDKLKKRWILTEEGKEYGVVIATTQKGRSNNVEQIRWKEEVIDRINEYLEK